jgi:hypothetical protein
MVIFSLLFQISKRKSDLVLKVVRRPECAREHQNRPAREVAPIPSTTPKTFCESFIKEKYGTLILSEILINN